MWTLKQPPLHGVPCPITCSMSDFSIDTLQLSEKILFHSRKSNEYIKKKITRYSHGRFWAFEENLKIFWRWNVTFVHSWFNQESQLTKKKGGLRHRKHESMSQPTTYVSSEDENPNQFESEPPEETLSGTFHWGFIFSFETASGEFPPTYTHTHWLNCWPEILKM